MWECSTCNLPIDSDLRGILVADNNLTNWRIVHKTMTCDPHTGPWHDLRCFTGSQGLRMFRAMQRDGAFRRLSQGAIDELWTSLTHKAPRHKPIHAPSRYRDGWLKLRFVILKRDDYRCQICGRTAQDGIKLEVDHKVARSKGGSDDPLNLWVLCFDCNRGKRDDDL